MLETDKMVLAHRGRSPAEAELARLLLHAAGIYAIVSDGDGDEPTSSRLLRPTRLDAGCDVFVPTGELTRARRLLGESRRVLC